MLLTILLTSLAVILLVAILNFASYDDRNKIVLTNNNAKSNHQKKTASTKDYTRIT